MASVKSTVSRMLLSRWLLVPAALVVGALAGAAATGLVMYRHYARSVTSQLPMQAYTQAIVAASLEHGEPAEARRNIRMDLRVTLYTLATRIEVFGGDFTHELRALRSVSTYYANAPDPELEPLTKQLLAQYPPFNEKELASGNCNSAICRLGQSSLASKPPRATISSPAPHKLPQVPAGTQPPSTVPAADNVPGDLQDMPACVTDEDFR